MRLARPFLLIGLALMLLSTAAHARITYGSRYLGPIWAVGDSITQGNGDASSESTYRSELYSRLTAGGFDFNYTGHWTRNSEGLPTTGVLPQDNLYWYHSGAAGFTISQTSARIAAWYDGRDYEGATYRVKYVRPQVILLMLGTNDVGFNITEPVAEAPDRLQALISKIYTLPGQHPAPALRPRRRR